MRTIFLIVLTLVTSSSFCQLQEFKWLIGTWSLKDKNVVETWSLDADGKSLRGVSLKMNSGDSTLLEETRLVRTEGSFFYIADVSGDQGAIRFRVSSFDETSFVAENPDHDFPKIIRYKVVIRDNREFLEAAIEGDGKVIPYNFEKVR